MPKTFCVGLAALKVYKWAVRTCVKIVIISVASVMARRSRSHWEQIEQTTKDDRLLHRTAGPRCLRSLRERRVNAERSLSENLATGFSLGSRT